MLRKDDTSKQLVYYQAGIGTYTNPVLVTPVISQVSETLDEMFAWNLSAHVKGTVYRLRYLFPENQHLKTLTQAGMSS